MERAAGALLLHQLLGEGSHPVVDERQELVRSSTVAVAGVHEELGNVSVTGQAPQPPDSRKKAAATCRDPGSIIALGISGNKQYEARAARDDVIGRPSQDPLGRE